MNTKTSGEQSAPAEAPTAVSQEPYRIGVGNWAAFNIPPESIFTAAERWSSLLKGAPRAWLCWNVDPDWCLVQQRLAVRMGWTPVIGGDPRAATPKLLPQSVLIDFNADFRFPTMWMHFALEFAFLYAEKLAFWHSDLLVREAKLREIVDRFEQLEDGAMVCTRPNRPLSQIFKKSTDRYWELIGCTTRGASRSQFEKGCGWWMNFAAHVNCRDEQERERRQQFYWDHGAGILYWAKKYGGKVHIIKEDEVSEGHCTRIGNQKYERLSPDNAARLLTKELSHNYDLVQACRKLGLDALLVD